MTKTPPTASRVRALLSAAAAVCAVVLALVGAAGAVLTDTTTVTQYLSWIPGAILWPVVLGLALAGLMAARAPRFGRKGRAPGGIAAACCLCFVAAGAGITREWRLHAFVRTAETDRHNNLRVFHWNMTSNHSVNSERPVTEIPGVGKPDLVLLSTTQPMKRFKKSSATLDGYELRRIGMFSVASRFPIITIVQRRILEPAQAQSLGVERRPPQWAVRLFNALARDAGASKRDFDDIDLGTLTMLRLDTRAEFGRPTVVWFLDLPSNPLVSRAGLAAVARSQMARIAHLADADPPLQSPQLCDPDLIIGDLNIPSGAASIQSLAPGFRSASHAAPPGRLASWPRRFPLWHIDHSLIGPHARASDYRLVQTGDSEHLAQIVSVHILPTKSALAAAPSESDNSEPGTRIVKESEE